MMKKRLSIALVALLVASCFTSLVACGDGESGTDSGAGTGEITTITIPTVTVDLVAPENEVAVSWQEASEVFDTTGRKLTKSEWLLNSKFSKEYVRSLGVGEYTFTYKSATKTGTITLIITDNQEPNYIFTADIPDFLTAGATIDLPTLVKHQDSYQEDYTPTYSLTRNGEEIEYKTKGDGYQAEALLNGEYEWKACLNVGGENKAFSQSFAVQTFETYLTSKQDKMLLNETTKEYLSVTDGRCAIDLSDNIGTRKFTMDWEVLDTAITAGKERLVVTVTTDTWFAENGTGENQGTMWVTDSWKDYKIGLSGKENRIFDNRKSSVPSYASITVNADGTYTYVIEAYLLRIFFSEKQPLQLWFATNCTIVADIEIQFV